MLRFERALSPKTFDFSRAVIQQQKQRIFGNYARALRGPNEISGSPEMVLVVIKRYFGDLTEARELTKVGSLKGPWWTMESLEI